MSSFLDARALAFVPFGYALQTRIRSPRNIVNTVATGWIPAVALIAQLGQVNLTAALLGFVLSYLCFISVYELGYYFNDTLGTRHDEVPRRRFSHRLTGMQSLLFVLIRVCVFGALGMAYGWLLEPLWLVFYAALAAVIIAHNTLRSTALKFGTFIQMSVMRFVAPVLPWLDIDDISTVALAGFVYFTYNRMITYMVGKGRLKLPEKANGWHLATVQLLFLPVTALLAIQSGEPVYLWLSAYFIVLYSAFQLLPVARSGLLKQPPEC